MRGAARARQRMVRRQLRRRGISDERVLAAMGHIPREAFLGPASRHLAYADAAIPIDHGQTISQPYIVALMAEALELRPSDKVLEIGTGSGYSAAIVSELVREVHSVERHGDLAAAATERLAGLGRANVRVHVGDGSVGLPEHAPFDAISVAAAGPTVPRALEAQLAPSGRLVVPVGPALGVQTLVRVRRTSRGLEREELTEVRFVPLLGDQGWEPHSAPF